MPTTPDETGLTPANALLGLAILTAIPVVMFALWADYYSRYVDMLNEKEPKYDRAAELRRNRIAGIWAFLTQLITFLASTPVRNQHPIAAGVLFLIALLVQGQLQFGVEKKVRALEAAAKDQLKFGLRSVGWGILVGTGYMLTVCLSFYAFHLAGKAFGLSGTGLAVTSATGGALGIFVGLALIFLMAPFQIRKLMPTEPLTDPATKAALEECFARARIEPPRLYVIEMDSFRWSNAMVAGFGKGRGWLQPALFITRSLLLHCSKEELQAIVSHEVSHLSLNHLRKRFFLSFFISIAAALVAGTVLISAHMIFPPATAGAFGIVALFIQIGLPLSAIRKQMLRHEEEADLHAVTRLGADVTSLIVALRKLDQLNDQPTGEAPRGGYVLMSGHPTTEHRIRLLKEKVPGAAVSGDTSERERDRAA